MIPHINKSNDLAVDANGLNDLKVSAKQNSPEAAREAGKQFEAVFIDMVVKSMREATPQDGPMDNEQSKMFTSMLDHQLSQSIANRGLGLADLVTQQLSGKMGGLEGELHSSKLEPGKHRSTNSGVPVSSRGKSQNVVDFQQKLSVHAEQASKATGIPAKFMLGQAALETGWGRHEIKAADGSASHNLFGIKANAAWKGKVVTAPTTEYVNGVAHTKLERFRAYDSYSEAFNDYANMLKSNPRYQNVIASAHDASAFAHGLQRAGYATDPLYAAKLTNIIKNTLV